MWELYTVWAFIPLLLDKYAQMTHQPLNVSRWSFSAIAAGCLGCIAGGLVSKRIGSSTVAFYQLLSSGICCLLTPLMFHAPPPVFLSFMIFWGIVVVGDSPQFSALTAQTAPRDLVGSALTIVTSIGFFITIISIQFTNSLIGWLSIPNVFLILIPGPVAGLIYLWPLFRDFQKKRL
jgi:MFS family permease